MNSAKRSKKTVSRKRFIWEIQNVSRNSCAEKSPGYEIQSKILHISSNDLSSVKWTTKWSEINYAVNLINIRLIFLSFYV